MAVNFIPTNKNYKRLYEEPIDPSLVWDNINDLREYLNDPTCYVNQIVGCNGTAYIVVSKGSIKDVEPIGTIGTSVNGLLFVGRVEPTGDEQVWIDTSDTDEEYTANLSDLVLAEIKATFQNMKDEINALKARVLYLEQHGVSPTPTPTDYVAMTDENGNVLTFEDGTIMCFEDTTTIE